MCKGNKNYQLKILYPKKLFLKSEKERLFQTKKNWANSMTAECPARNVEELFKRIQIRNTNLQKEKNINKSIIEGKVVQIPSS